MSRRAAPWILSICLAAVACGGGGRQMDPAEFEADVASWRETRVARLTGESGWLTLVALHWLPEGDTRFGTAGDNDLVLPEGSGEDHGGMIRLESGIATLYPTEGAKILVDDQPASAPIVLRHDSDDSPSTIEFGRLSMFLLQRGDAYAIRVKDPESPVRTGFQGLDYFEPDQRFRVNAEFRPYEEPKEIEIPTVQNTVGKMLVPGTVEFRLNGRDYSLQVFVDTLEDEELFVIFKDETSGKESYGLGRYVYAPRTGSAVTLDFNRAYNPPCAFTAFATCPLPPKQNWMELEVRAGEKSYAKPDYL